MFISDHIFKFHNLFYKQVALLISYRSAQTSENILQNRNQRQITVSFNRYYMKMVIFWRNKKGELRLYQLAWTNSLLNKSHMVDYLVFHLSFLILIFGSFCRYRKASYFWSFGISLYLELFCFLSFITIVLRNLCSGTHRRNPFFPL